MVVNGAGAPAASAPVRDAAGEAPRDESRVDQPHRYPYQPALDGVRAVAVIAVVLFHFDVAFARGGFLGVDVFLALSGFLITTLLLREHASSGRISIGAFYGRRARRLLPAVLVLLAAIALYGAFFADQLQLVKLRGDALASLFYVANWRFVFSGAGYFEQFASPSPVSHLWSLAIEEQWYLVWPILVAGLLSWVGSPVGRSRRVWLGLTVGLAAGSATLMALLVDNADVNRVYYGTDTRAQTLLVGALLAVVLHARALSAAEQRWVDRLGLAGLAACLVLFAVVDADDTWMYRGGFVAAALAATALIAGAAGPDRGWSRTILSLPPLPELGRISYGVYLWHWPAFVFLSEERTGLDGTGLLVVRVAVTLLVSIASYHVVEQPIRHHRWPIGRAAAMTGIAIAACALLIAVVVPVRTNPDAELAAARSGSSELALRSNESPTARRLLVVGDSVGLGLALHHPKAAFDPPFVLRSLAQIGCGVAERDEPKCDDPTADWRAAVGAFDPDTTVLMAGVWDARRLTIGGRVYEPGSPDFEDYLLTRLDAELAALTTRGGGVAVLTVPCFAPRKASTVPLPEDAEWFNSLLRVAVAKAGPGVKLVDYAAFMCPGGENRPTMNGVLMRNDGIHLTPAGAELVWKWLVPQLPGRA